MPLSELRIHHVRNLRQVVLSELGTVNAFFGANGSGKTSVLEAIHLLGMARSFRGSSAKTLITHGEQACVVQAFVQRDADFGRSSLGVQRHLDGSLVLRINGETERSVATLVEALPLQVINADSFDLLTGSPAARRQYLNWGVFHVEHRFYPEWQRFQRCIKQRNTGLRRDKLGRQAIQGWTRELARSGTQLNAYRRQYFSQLAPLFREIMGRLLPQLGDLELRFRQGWDKKFDYAEALEASFEGDLERGFTQLGPQRADLRITLDSRQAADVLSRGQQKLVVCALKLAQGQLLKQLAGRQCSYLVDDLPSELDRNHCQRVCSELDQLGSQVFITCVEREDINAVWPGVSPPAMFHVEHGRIEEAVSD